MAASATDKFKKLTNNFATTLSGPIVGAGDSSMSLLSTTNLPTDTGSVYVIDRVNSSGTPTPSVREYVKGTVVGSNVTNLVRGLGGSTAQAHSTGAVVEQVVDQNTINDLVDGILAQHNQDGTHGAVTATSVSATGVINASSVSSLQDASTALSSYRTDYAFDYVASGCVWSGDSYGSTRAASMAAGLVYINGQRGSISSVTARTFTASKDTYVDVLNTAGVFTLVYTEVTNNAASPALASNSIRIGIIVTGAGNIAAASSVNQGQEDRVLPIASSVAYSVSDSLGNLICPRDPNRKILGYRQTTAQVTSTQTTSNASSAIAALSLPVIIPTGRKVKVSLWSGGVANTTATAITKVAIWEGTVGSGTQVAQMGSMAAGADGNNGQGEEAKRIYTPTSTTITYNGSLFVSAGTGALNSSALAPTFLMVELV